MLFFYFLAGPSAAPGWMVFWAILGTVFSKRPAYLFVLPLLAAVFSEPKLGVLIVVTTWAVLVWREINKERMKQETLIAAVTLRAARTESPKFGA